MLVCITNGTNCLYNNNDSNCNDRHCLFKEIGLDLNRKIYVERDEFVKQIADLKLSFKEDFIKNIKNTLGI